MKTHRPALVGLVLFAARLGRSAEEPFQKTCAESCQNALGPIPFGDFVLHGTFEKQKCHSILSLTSTYLCIDLHCGGPTRRIALERMNDTCQKLFNISVPDFPHLTNYTGEEISHITRIDRNDTLGPQKPRHDLVLPSPEYFDGWHQTLDGWSYTNLHHLLYGAAVITFWVLVIAAGFCHRLCLIICRLYYSFPQLQLIQLPLGRNSWLKRRLCLPATFGYRCAQSAWGCTVPPRIQSLAILMFIAINILYSVIGYRFTHENYYFDTVLDQALRYVSDRTGIISFANFPLIWLFGMRNHFALWLTGWDFGTYNNFHRWTARVAALQATVHSVGYTIILLRQGGLNDLYTEFLKPYWHAGVLATIFMCLLIPFSIPFMRRHHYETFLALHIGFSILILFSMLGHVSIFDGRWDGLVRVPAFIWIFDRIMRMVRIAAFRPLSWSSEAHASYCAAADIVQLSIPVESYSLHKPIPGTFYYLTVLSDVKSRLQNHPFTVASVVTTRPDIEVGERTALLVTAHRSANKDKLVGDTSSTFMQFLIRPYDGFTARLRELAKNTKSFRVLVEGPYGTTHPLQTYTRVVFIVGGTGIVTPISYMRSLTRDSKKNPEVALHWAVREPAFASVVLKQHLNDALKSDNVSTTLHASTLVELQPSFSQNVKQEIGRPDISIIIASAATATGRGRLAVVACGPESLDTGFGDQCCGNDSYCFVSINGESRCCPLGSNCVADSKCNSQSYYCTRTATPVLVSSAMTTPTETGCCGRKCLKTRYYLCPAELGGNCCPYGSECRADGSCVAAMSSSTTSSTTNAALPLPTSGCAGVACTSAAAEDASGGLSTSTKAGIAVTVVAGAFVAVGLLSWLWFLKRRKSDEPHETSLVEETMADEIPTDGASDEEYFGIGPALPGASRAVPSQPQTPGDITTPVEIDSALVKEKTFELDEDQRVNTSVEVYELEAVEARHHDGPNNGVGKVELLG